MGFFVVLILVGFFLLCWYIDRKDTELRARRKSRIRSPQQQNNDLIVAALLFLVGSEINGPDN